MKLIRYDFEGSGPRLGVLDGSTVIDAAHLFEAGGRIPPSVVTTGDMRNICTVSELVVEFLREFLVTLPPEALKPGHHGCHLLGEVRLLPPIADPGKIICVGLNYRLHCEEQGKPIPETPVIFAKMANAITGPGDTVACPPTTTKMDYEGELAVVIGTRARGVSAGDALSHVFGYTILNDLTARDLQKRDGQWLRAKSQDGFAPMGPCIVTADEVPDPQRLHLRTRLNDSIVQDTSTSDMVFSIAQLIEFICEGMTLEPGDIISTGTPGGVGVYHDPPRFLGPGDRVEIEILPIGVLTTTIA